MNIEDFRKNGYKLIDWIAEYYKNIEQYPVKSQVGPGEIYNSIPAVAPEKTVDFDAIMSDFDEKILGGITHWQHPGYFAYFNANTSFPSILGELLTSAIGAQCMIWETSPAAAELEERVCEWLRAACNLPENWHGVIQDTASTATLCALLMAREKYSGFRINNSGFGAADRFVVYCSAEAHSSVEKGVKIAGFGREHIRKIEVDDNFATIPDALERQIQNDLKNGSTPLCVVSAVGTTGSHGMDPVSRIGEISRKYDLFHHVDAAHAGNAVVLPEYQWLIDGVDLADSYVFNPHKWMFTNFDCSLFYVKDKDLLIKTFEILPEYLKTGIGKEVNDYRDWGIQLGRRFRALKLWFVLRSYGLDGIREKIRFHIELAHIFAEKLERDGRCRLLAPVHLNLVCFNYCPAGNHALESVNELNKKLKDNINATGKAYLTHTKLNGIYTLRVCIGQTNVERRHVDDLFDLLMEQITLLEV